MWKDVMDVVHNVSEGVQSRSFVLTQEVIWVFGCIFFLLPFRIMADDCSVPPPSEHPINIQEEIQLCSADLALRTSQYNFRNLCSGLKYGETRKIDVQQYPAASAPCANLIVKIKEVLKDHGCSPVSYDYYLKDGVVACSEEDPCGTRKNQLLYSVEQKYVEPEVHQVLPDDPRYILLESRKSYIVTEFYNAEFCHGQCMQRPERFRLIQRSYATGAPRSSRLVLPPGEDVETPLDKEIQSAYRSRIERHLPIPNPKCLTHILESGATVIDYGLCLLAPVEDESSSFDFQSFVLALDQEGSAPTGRSSSTLELCFSDNLSAWPGWSYPNFDHLYSKQAQDFKRAP